MLQRIRQMVFVILMMVAGIMTFGKANQVEAKIQFTDDTILYKNEPENAKPSTFSYITSINKNGTLIYDDDTIQQKDVIEAAAAHWNKAVGIDLIMSYQQAHVAKADADVIITAADLPNGEGAVTGWGGIVYLGQQNIIKIANGTLNRNITSFVQAVSTTSHEMGHALGINHDPGPLMGTSGGADLAKGILPDIPDYNVNAIGDLLAALPQLYPGAKPVTIPNMTDGMAYRDAGTTENILPTDPIAKMEFDAVGNHMVTRQFTGGTVVITGDEHVFQVGRGCIGSTDSLKLIHSKQQVVTVYISSDGARYYQIKVGNQYYIIWSGYTTISGEAYRDAGTGAQVAPTDLIAKMVFDAVGNHMVSRQFTGGTVEITGDEHVFLVGIGCVGSTNSLNLTHTKQPVVTIYHSSDGAKYYQIKVGDQYYVIWSGYTKISGDAYRDTGTTTVIAPTDPIGQLFSGGGRFTTRDFNTKTIEITSEENVYQVGVGYVGSTNDLNLTHTQQRVLTTYSDVEGAHYYQIHVGDQYYVIWRGCTKDIS